MLRHVDVFLGVALVMLGISLLITIVTQTVSFVTNMRGRLLCKGIGELLETLSVNASQKANAKLAAQTILRHPLIADGLGPTRLAPAVSRTDLVNLLKRSTLTAATDPIIAPFADLGTQVETWFDATMGRVSLRFTTATRLVTIVAATIAAFSIQLDAFALVRRLYADSELRANLAGATTAMLNRAEGVLATPEVFDSVGVALAATSQGGLTAPAGNPKLASRDDAQKWIRSAPIDDKAKKSYLEQYDSRLQDALSSTFPKLIDQAASIKGDLDRTGLRLIPEPYHPFEFDSFSTFLGVLASAALLSLGAPFWFNALKTLSNLRPSLAAQVDERDPQGAPSSDGSTSVV